jgi:hypothetical protein
VRVKLIVIFVITFLSTAKAQDKFNIGLDFGWSLISRYTVEANVKYRRFEVFTGIDSYYLNPNKLKRQVFGYHLGGNYYWWSKYCKYYVSTSLYKMKFLWNTQDHQYEMYNFHYDLSLINSSPDDIRMDFTGYNFILGANWPIGKNFFTNLEIGWTRGIDYTQNVYDGYSTCETGFCSEIQLYRIKTNLPFFNTGIKYYFGSKLEPQVEEQ